MLPIISKSQQEVFLSSSNALHLNISFVRRVIFVKIIKTEAQTYPVKKIKRALDLWKGIQSGAKDSKLYTHIPHKSL